MISSCFLENNYQSISLIPISFNLNSNHSRQTLSYAFSMTMNKAAVLSFLFKTLHISWVSPSNTFVVHLHFQKPSCSLLKNSKCSENLYNMCVIILKHTKMYLSDYFVHSLIKAQCLSFYQPVKGVIIKRELRHA